MGEGKPDKRGSLYCLCGGHATPIRIKVAFEDMGHPHHTAHSLGSFKIHLSVGIACPEKMSSTLKAE